MTPSPRPVATLLRFTRVLPLALTAAALLTIPACGQRSLMAVKQSGERAYELGNFTQAEADFREYVERNPGDPVGRYNLGRTYLKTEPPRPALAREQLMVAYWQKGQDDQVLESLCEALAEAKQNEELYKLLRSRAVDRQQVSDYLRLARYAQRLGDVDQARQALLTAAKIDGGKSIDLQLAIADFYTSVGDTDKARQRLRMAYYLNPNSPKVIERIRATGAVPGPTFAVQPEEMADAVPQ